MHGPFDYNATTIAPPGIKTLVYETPQQRKTWAQHGVDAWYIRYCPDHYRCHKTYVPATRRERISHTVSFSPHDFAVPAKNHQDDIARSIRDLQLRSNTATCTLLYNLLGTNNLRPYKHWKTFFSQIFHIKKPKRLSIQQWNPQKLLFLYNKYNNSPQFTSLLNYRNNLEAT